MSIQRAGGGVSGDVAESVIRDLVQSVRYTTLVA